MKRLIEVAFPIKEVSDEALREKNIRHGHISTLHIWWARRPLAAMRAAIYAALVGEDKNSEDTKRFIANLAKWENSLNFQLLAKARDDIRKANGGQPPKVLDCFAGGGSIPLEALRLGCESYALEYNPVAVLILKATVEFPMKFGQRLIDEVKKWGEWVLEQARSELEAFYPADGDGFVPVGYIWARTIPCKNLRCGAEIPLMRQFWLAKKPKRQIALFPIVDKERKQVDFAIVQRNYSEWQIVEAPEDVDFEVPKNFDPTKGTVKRARATCLVCNSVVPDKDVREMFRKGKAGQRMVAVVLHHPEETGKRYRLPTQKDLQAFQEAEKALEQKVEELKQKWEIEPVPNEPLPLMTGTFNVPLYGMTTWGDLFNSRQKLALLTFADKVREAYEQMVNSEWRTENGDEFAKAVATYLALAMDRLASAYNTLCRWQPNGEKIADVFSRQALPIVWDYPEVNPFSEASRSWSELWEDSERVLSHCAQIPANPAEVLQGSALQLPYPDENFDAVITDPPYYFNVPYSDLSDFFYVWLKRTIGHLYPDFFISPLTPKNEELCQMENWDRERYAHKDKAWFEQMLTQAFCEIARVLKDDGIAVIVFAHKSVEAWDAIINALLNAGLTMTASWAVKMEREARLRGHASAALLSSVLMVCRKRAAKEIGDYPKVLQEMGERISERLETFWQAGLRGADFFMSAIGPAVEVFGRYEKVEKPTGEPATVSELLSEVRRIVAEDALKRILHNPNLSEVDEASRFYLLWRWTFNGMKANEQSELQTEDESDEEDDKQKQKSRTPKVPYDDARLIAQAIVGAEGVKQKDWERWNFLKIERGSKGATVQVLPADERKDEEFHKSSFNTMIDALHFALRLWWGRNYEELQNHLARTYGNSDAFWRYAQSLADILPEGDKERQWLHGLLVWYKTGFDRIETGQFKLFKATNQ